MGPAFAEPRGYLFLSQAMKRGRFLVWLRRAHAWIGFWGAVMGLLFGVSGILLNHRDEMKIPLASQEETRETMVPACDEPAICGSVRGMATHGIQTARRQVPYPEEARRAGALGRR